MLNAATLRVTDVSRCCTPDDAAAHPPECRQGSELMNERCFSIEGNLPLGGGNLLSAQENLLSLERNWLSVQGNQLSAEGNLLSEKNVFS